MVLVHDEKAEIAADIARLVGDPSGRDMAMGGAFEGASRFDQSIARWNPNLGSADFDLLSQKPLLDARTRDSFRNDAYLQGGQTIHKDGIVGSFFFLNAKPEFEVLGLTQEWAEQFQTEVEALFTLWAESNFKWIDAARTNTFTDLIRLTVGVYATGGEVLATVEWLRDRGRDFHTAIQMVDCDRLATPFEYAADPSVRAGIRRNTYGAPQSYFIRIGHPRDTVFTRIGADRFREVEAYKPWGRQQVIYLREQIRIDQTRAVGDIVAGLKEIAITRKFRDVTLQNAVVNAIYAASIESELPAEAVYAQMGGGGVSAGAAAADFASSYLAAVGDYVGASKNLMIDGVRIPHMFPGTKLQLRPAGSPGGVGQGFEQSLLRYIAAALNVSYEELSRDFTKTNYSSARAALAQTYRFMQSRKRIAADGMANAIYRLWLEEAINKNLLRSFPASEAYRLYTDSHLNILFDAITTCDWTGAARGQIDELKETQAAVLRIKYGLSTHEDELVRLGKDWRKVYAQLERERKEREARGIILLEDNSVNAASGSPRESQEEGAEADNGE